MMDAWRCPCGEVNLGPFGAAGVNDGRRYSVCRGCCYEVVESSVAARYVLVEVAVVPPWRPADRPAGPPDVAAMAARRSEAVLR